MRRSCLLYIWAAFLTVTLRASWAPEGFDDGERLAVDKPIYSDGNRLSDLEIEEGIIDRLEKLQNELGTDDDGLQKDIEIDMEPDGAAKLEDVAGDGETKAKVEEEEKKEEKPKRVGQKEYTSFLEASEGVAPARELNKIVLATGDEGKRALVGAGSQSNTFWGRATGNSQLGNVVFLTMVSVCTVAAMFGMVVAGVFWYKIHKQKEAAEEAEYPQYGVIGPSKGKKSKRQAAQQQGDASMAYGAQLHHYQQTKQKIISMEQAGGGTGVRASGADGHSDDSDVEAVDDEGDYSVYECPGLAPTGDIEVANPLFDGGANGAKRDSDSESDKQRHSSEEKE